MSDKYSTHRGRKSAEALRGRSSGGKLPMFKIKKKVTELFILTPKDIDAPVVFTSYVHKFTQGHGKNFKVLKQCASPAFTQEQDEITDLGWKLRDEYKSSDSKSKADFYKQLVADNDDYILVLDVNDVERGPQIFKMPYSVSKVVIPALDTCMTENDGDLHDYCHPEEGKILVIETNGETGFSVRYTEVYFDEDKPSCLFSDKIISEEKFDEVLKNRPLMDKLQPPFSKEEFEAYIDFCFEKADEIGINLDDIGKEDEQEEVNYSSSDDSTSSDVDLDSELDTSDEEENEAEETSTRSSRSSRSDRTERSSRPARGGRASRRR